MSIYENIIQGLGEAIAYEKGENKARSVSVTIMPPPNVSADEIKDLRHTLNMTQRRMTMIKFRNEEHKSNFERFCNMFGANLDEYRLAVAYLLALDSECCKHYKDIFDFSEGVIKPEGLTEGWQTGTSSKTTRLIFNLWNGYQSEGEPLEEETPSCYYTPEHIFSCSYAPYYWQAIQLRYPDYCEE